MKKPNQTLFQKELGNIISIFGLPCGSACKESTCNVGDLGSILGLGRFPGEEKEYSLQYSGLENSLGCIVHGVTKSQTQLSHFYFHFHLYNWGFPSDSLVKTLPQCSNHRRCRFGPWVGSVPWRRPWQPIPAFLPGEFHGQWSLADYRPETHKELDTTEVT